MSMLQGKELSKRFGGVLALNEVDFAIRKGTIIGLIGPNGAGKTTIFNIVAGAFKPSNGRVVFEGNDITGLMPYQVCLRGIARTFQVARPFLGMTCMENVMVPAINRANRGAYADNEHLALESLEFVGLRDQKDVPANNLNLIDKKRLEMARALATKPRLLLLDEVLGGLNTQEIVQAVDLIQKLRDDRGLTIFWIEHVMGAIMRAAERIIVLNQGTKLMEGPPSEVVKDERVIKAYLGR